MRHGLTRSGGFWWRSRLPSRATTHAAANRSLPGGAEAGEKDRRKNCKNNDDNQQFDQRKRAAAMFHDEEKLVCIRGGDAVPVRVRKLQLQNQVTLAAELRAARVDPVKIPGHSLCFLVRILGYPLWIALARHRWVD